MTNQNQIWLFPDRLFHLLVFPSLVWYMVAVWSIAVPVILLKVLFEVIRALYLIARLIYVSIKQAREVK